MEYVAKFDVKCTDDLLKEEELKSTLEETLVGLHNDWAKENNKHIDEWNSEWEKTGKSFSDPEYMDVFIKSKMAETMHEIADNVLGFINSLTPGCKTIAYIGNEFELHVKIEDESSWMDVSFHIEKEP